ncbi:MAG: glycosyltransferase family 4 protein [Ignavibacteria bacterium]
MSIKVLHLHTSLRIVCGITNQIITYARDDENIKHYIFTLASEYQTLNGISSDRLIVCKTKNIALLREIIVIKKLLSIIDQESIQILHSHHRYFDFLAAIVSKFRKIKRITSVHNIVKGKKFFSYKSPQLIADSLAVRNHLVKYFGVVSERIKVIYNSIDPKSVTFSTTRIDLLQKLGLTTDNFIIGYVGRFSIKEKGIDLLLESFAIFNQQHKNSRLIMIGEGKDIKKRKFNFENVIILPPVLDIYNYFQTFDCIILPSRSDAFPVTMLIAGICCTPFIGSDTDGIEEFITDEVEGLLFKRNDKYDLLEKLELLHYNYEDALKRAKNLREKVVSKCNFQDLKQDLYKVYVQL